MSQETVAMVNRQMNLISLWGLHCNWSGYRW